MSFFLSEHLNIKVLTVLKYTSITKFFVVFQKYGISLTALAKLQMNVLIEKNDGTEFFKDISQKEIFYPFAWIEEGIPGPSEVIIFSLTVSFPLGIILRC